MPGSADEVNRPGAGHTRRLALVGLIVSAMTGISRVAGLARDVVIAMLFGASGDADAFFVAFRIPNLFRRMFAEGAFTQGFVPVLAEVRTRRPADVMQFLARVTGNLALVLAVLTGAGVIFAPAVVAVFAPGFTDDDPRATLAVEMTRLTFPYLLLISLTAMAGGVQNTWGRFALPAVTPVLLNISLIASAWIGVKVFDLGVVSLAIGVLVGGVAQLALQIPVLARMGVLSMPRVNWLDPDVRRVMSLMVPGMIGASVAQINLLIDTILASWLITGSISWLYYADRLMELPVGLVAAALGTVLLPALSARVAADDAQGFRDVLDWGLKSAVMLGVPAAVGLIALAEPLLITLFGYGALQPGDVTMSALALRGFCVGLAGFVVVRAAAPGYFARQDTRTPLRIAMVAVAVNVTLNLALIGPLGHVGLALATGTSGLVNAALLVRGLHLRGEWRPGRDWVRVGLAVLIGSVCLWTIVRLLDVPATAWHAMVALERGARLGVMIAAGAAAYGAVLWAAGIRPRQLVRQPSVGGERGQ